MARLLEPLLTEKLQLANRLVLPPMATNKGNPDGSISEAVLAYYDEKSRGGMGAVLTEHMFIAPEGQFRGGMLSACDDALIGGLTRLASVIHANGPKVVMQINHAGGAASSENTGRDDLAPGDLGGRRATRVVDLHDDLGAVRVDDGREPGEAAYQRVITGGKHATTELPLRSDEHVLGEHSTHAAA